MDGIFSFYLILFVIAESESLIVLPYKENSEISQEPLLYFNAVAGEPFDLLCLEDLDSNTEDETIKWLDPYGDIIKSGSLGVKPIAKNKLKLSFGKSRYESGWYTCSASSGSVEIFLNFNNNRESTTQEKDVFKLEKSGTQRAEFFSVSPPKFDKKIEHVAAERYSKLQISCSAIGELPLSYKWYDTNSKLLSTDERENIYTSSTFNESLLIIRSVNDAEEGLYTCTASNEHGLSSKLYNVTLHQSSGNESNNITSIERILTVEVTTTKVRFDISVLGTVDAIHAEYSEDLSANVSEIVWSFGTKYEVTDLLPSGNYTFQFKLPDQSQYLLTMQVIMLPDVPQVIFRGLNNGQLKIEWFKPFDDFRRGTIDKYALSYNTVRMQGSNDWKADDCVISIEIPSCGGRTYSLSGLSSGDFSYYEIRFRAHTAAGWGLSYYHKVHA